MQVCASLLLSSSNANRTSAESVMFHYEPDCNAAASAASAAGYDPRALVGQALHRSWA